MNKYITLLGLTFALSTALSAQESSVEFYDNTGTNVKASTGYKEDNGGRYHITTEGVERIKVIKDSLDVSGAVKANKYYGDGSGLTGIKVEGPTSTDVANTLKADNAFLNSVKGAKGDSGAKGDQGPEGPIGSFDPDANIIMDSLHTKKGMRVDGSLNVGIGNVDGRGLLNINSQTKYKAHIVLSGQEYHMYNNSSTTGIGIILGVNRGNHKQLWFMNNALAQNTEKSMLRFAIHDGVPWIDAVSTDGLIGKPLSINPRSNLYLADGLVDAKVGIGTTNPQHKLHVEGNIYASGTITPSDNRYKTNITPIDSSLLKILALKGVYYNWDIAKWPSKNFSDKKQIGLIAQEVEKIIPEVVNTDKEGYKSLAYDKLTAVLINAVQDLKKENDSLKNEVYELKTNSQKSIVQKLEAENQQLKNSQASILTRLEALEKSTK